MLSFAPIRYHSVLAEQGGPIARISATTLSIFDRVMVQANAFLDATLTEGKPKYAFYGSADGTGSSANPAAAQHVQQRRCQKVRFRLRPHLQWHDRISRLQMAGAPQSAF